MMQFRSIGYSAFRLRLSGCALVHRCEYSTSSALLARLRNFKGSGNSIVLLAVLCPTRRFYNLVGHLQCAGNCKIHDLEISVLNARK